MALSRFMKKKCGVHVIHLAKAQGLDVAGMPTYAAPVQVSVYAESGFVINKLSGEGGRQLTDLDSFILDTGGVVPEQDDIIWMPGVDHTATPGQKLVKVIPVPDFNNTISHYECFL